MAKKGVAETTTQGLGSGLTSPISVLGVAEAIPPIGQNGMAGPLYKFSIIFFKFFLGHVSFLSDNMCYSFSLG
jgi:hypothetical protein